MQKFFAGNDVADYYENLMKHIVKNLDKKFMAFASVKKIFPVVNYALIMGLTDYKFICLDLNIDVKQVDNYDKFLNVLHERIAATYKQNFHLIANVELGATYKEQFESYMNKSEEIDEYKLIDALDYLGSLLNKYFTEKFILLIDGYDSFLRGVSTTEKSVNLLRSLIKRADNFSYIIVSGKKIYPELLHKNTFFYVQNDFLKKIKVANEVIEESPVMKI